MVQRAKESDFEGLKGRVSQQLQLLAEKEALIEQLKMQVVESTSQICDQHKLQASK